VSTPPNSCGHHRPCRLADKYQAHEKILAAIRSFSFDDYGCDDMMELVADEGLDVGRDLATHIARALDERTS
jgi:hypothetical protein